METRKQKIRKAKIELHYCNYLIKLYWEKPCYISEERIKYIVERKNKAEQQLKELEDGNKGTED